MATYIHDSQQATRQALRSGAALAMTSTHVRKELKSCPTCQRPQSQVLACPRAHLQEHCPQEEVEEEEDGEQEQVVPSHICSG